MLLRALCAVHIRFYNFYNFVTRLAKTRNMLVRKNDLFCGAHFVPRELRIRVRYDVPLNSIRPVRLFKLSMKMMCDNTTCDKSCTKTEIFYENDLHANDFITNLQHEKCKVVKLVRSQIHRLEDTQNAEMWSYSGEIFAGDTGHDGNLGKPDEPSDIFQLSGYTDVPQNTTVTFRSTSSRVQVQSAKTWLKRIVHRLRQRLNLIIAGLVIGALVWLSLVYGALLGASLCGNGRPYLTTFRYTHAKHSLF